MARKPLILQQDRETGCIVPVSHKLNPDGYFRKYVEGRHRMYHVHIWEQANGPLPHDHEVHHTCGNRACCNPDHLEAVPSREHTIQGNQQRYARRYMEAAVYWLEHRCTGTELGKKFGVTFSTGCRWIQEWKGKARRPSSIGVGPCGVAVMLARSARQKMCRLLMIWPDTPGNGRIQKG